MSAMIEYFNYLEGGVCQRINRISHRAWLRWLFLVVSKLGDGGYWGLVALAVLYIQGPAAIPVLLQVGVTALVGVFVYKMMKTRLVRERPYINHGGILCGAAPLDRYSFPSGHTLHAVSFTVMFAQVEPTLMPLIVPFAVLVAASRIILGLHYPSDVLAGAAIGALLATVSMSFA